MSVNDADLDITLIHQLLPITTFRLSSENILTRLTGPAEVEAFFKTKHDNLSPPGTTSVFKIAGANTTFNSSILSILYE